MLTTFLIVLGILALFGAGDAGDACAITLLLKIVPFLIIWGLWRRSRSAEGKRGYFYYHVLLFY